MPASEKKRLGFYRMDLEGRINFINHHCLWEEKFFLGRSLNRKLKNALKYRAVLSETKAKARRKYIKPRKVGLSPSAREVLVACPFFCWEMFSRDQKRTLGFYRSALNRTDEHLTLLRSLV
jgi:hypothetical protein